MPNLQDIERFKQDVRTLGRETELLESWGEVYEDVPPPEQGVPADLSELMEPGTEESGGTGEGDLASFLDSLSLSPDSGGGEPESPLAEDLEAPDAFSPEPGESAVEALGKPAVPFEGLSGIPGEEGLADQTRPEPAVPPPEDEGAIPEGLLSGLTDELETARPEGEDADFGDLGALAEPAPGIVDDFPSFDIPDIGPAPDESPEAEPAFPEDAAVPEIPEAESALFEESEPAAGEGLETGPGAGEEAASFEEMPLVPEEMALFGESEPLESGESPHEEFSEAGGFDVSIPDLGDSGEEPAELGGPSEAESSGDFGELGAAPTAEGSGDDFDTFRLDETDFSAAPPSPGGGNLNLDEELASLENDLTPSETFNLEGAWGDADFSIPGYETPAPAPTPGKAKAKPASGAAQKRADRGEEPFREPPQEPEEGPAPEVALTEHQVDALQDTLLSYPLNLRLAIEEALAEERGTEDQRARLVHLLVRGASPGEAADLASRILKRPIAVPRDFQKRTGAELEAEKGSLRYILIHTVAPIAAMVLAVVLGLGALGFLGYRFVFRPIKAELLYREGYEEIRRDQFPAAEATFLKADKIWVHKRWYYRYAEAFAAKNQFIAAARRYDALLDRWPNDRKGVLDYATMEFRSRLDYPKAAKLLKGFIEARHYFDKEALMLLGDVYLEWAENEGDRGGRLFEDARLQYSTLVEKYGPEDPYLERMLRWFLRTDRALGKDNSEEIRKLKDRFMASPKTRISSETLADLGGYLLDRGEVEDVSRILLRAVDQDPSVPEAHYELSRYFRRIGDAQEERTALANTVRLLEAVENPTNRRIGMLVEALNRSGEGYAELGEYVTAEEMFTKAVRRYERALSLGQLRKGPVYGKAYANLADVLFFQRDDLDGAALLYEKAHDHGYVTPDTRYKLGYIHYRRERWESALEEFYKAGLDSEESPYLLYATGNALFQREDFFAAQGYYARLEDRLEFELDQLPLIEPQVRPSHGEIVDLLMRTSNNLGVALYRIGNRMGDARRRAEAMAQFMDSSRYYDALERDPATMIRPETKNLGYLNLDFVLHPQRGIDLSIYPDIPKRMKFPKN